MDRDPILTNREKGTILKAGLGLAGFLVLAPYVVGALAIGFLLFVALFGIVAGVAEWFLRYGLPTLGVFVVCVLVLRWLARDSTPRRLGLPVDPIRRVDEAKVALDAQLEVARIKAELQQGPEGR